MEDRITGYGSEVIFGNPEELLGGVEADTGGHHGGADEGRDAVLNGFELQVEVQHPGAQGVDFPQLLLFFVNAESPLLLQDAEDLPPLFRRFIADAHIAVLSEVVFHSRFLLVFFCLRRGARKKQPYRSDRIAFAGFLLLVSAAILSVKLWHLTFRQVVVRSASLSLAHSS